jgi:hypothetical protein
VIVCSVLEKFIDMPKTNEERKALWGVQSDAIPANRSENGELFPDEDGGKAAKPEKKSSWGLKYVIFYVEVCDV